MNYITCNKCDHEELDCQCEKCERCGYQSDIKNDFELYSEGDFVAETLCKGCIKELEE